MKTIETKIRTYYTLGDLMGENVSPLGTVPTLQSIVSGIMLNEESAEVRTIITNSKVEKLWNSYIYPSMHNQFVAYSDEDDIDRMRAETFELMVLIFRETLPYYETLIDLYENEKANLMKKITNISKTESKRNDTPQEKGQWNADQYSSEVNSATVESSSDVATVEDRLDNIKKKWDNLYQNWLSEFDKMLIFCYN